MRLYSRILFPILTMLLGFIFVFLLLEIFLRWIGPQWLKTRMREVGVENIVGVEHTVFGSDQDWPAERVDGKFIKFTPYSQFRIQHYEYDIVAHVDQWGGRQSVIPENQNEGEFIPFLGDSFTFGVGVKDDETYVHLLIEKLKYRFLNLGVPGSALVNQLDIVESRHQDLNRPSFYIFNFFIGNDLTNIFTENVFGPHKQHSADLSSELSKSRLTYMLQFINDFIRQNKFLRKIYFIQFVKSKFLIAYNHYRASKGISRRMDDEFFQVIIRDQHFNEMLGFLDKDLDRLILMAQNLNFKSVFILIPDRHQVYQRLFEYKLQYYGLKLQDVDSELLNKTLSVKLHNRGIATIDTLDCLKKRVQRFPDENLYFTLDNHLTPQGHRAVAQCLENSLRNILPVSDGSRLPVRY